MNRQIPYVENELRIVGTFPALFGGPDLQLRDTPVLPKENMVALYYDRHPYWTPTPADHMHSKGRFVTLHSCGHTETRVDAYIAAGFDSWDPQIMNDTQRLYEEVGDKIIIGVVPDPFDPEKTSEDEQRARARAYVDRFCKPGKCAIISNYGAPALTPAFSEELYVYSRKKFGE
jgi:hypothetical protein